MGVVRLATAGICHRLGLDHETAEDFKLASTEACGHLLNMGALDIEVNWEIHRDAIHLAVQAVGELDPELVNDEADLEWKEIGLVLVDSVMDEVQESTSPPGLRLLKRTVVHDE